MLQYTEFGPAQFGEQYRVLQCLSYSIKLLQYPFAAQATVVSGHSAIWAHLAIWGSYSTKLNCDEICIRRLQKTPEGTDRSGGLEAARRGWLAPPPCRPAPPVGFFHALLEYSSTAS
jgi:hypothetical protein